MMISQAEYLFVAIAGLIAVVALMVSGIAQPVAVLASVIVGMAVGISACGVQHG